MKEIKESKFRDGQIVWSKKDPSVKLIIRRYFKRIYYCKFADCPELQEVALFEREITENQAVPVINTAVNS